MIEVRVIPTADAYGGPTWLVEADDGARSWADTCWSQEEAEELAADIRDGIFDPWEDA